MDTSLVSFISWLDTHTNLEKERDSIPPALKAANGLRAAAVERAHTFNLSAIKALCAASSHPERAAKTVHVAGSKGKGSACKMIGCILSAHGIKTGVYLSPHVSDFRERVGSADGYFTDDIYSLAAAEVMAAEAAVRAKGVKSSWFELVTLFAFICFRLAETKINVIEVGIGGRLDATNVVMPSAVCIMPIELEHTAWLGNTIKQIAREKAGIIKRGVPVVAAEQPYNEAMQVIEARARELSAPLYKAFGRIHAPAMMAGKQMEQNAMAASMAARIVFPAVTDEDIKKGLSVASLPARFECFSYNGCRVIIDGAHTVFSIRAMLETLESLCLPCASLVFGCANDKDVEDMAVLLSKYKWKAVTLTMPGSLPRADLKRTEAAFRMAGVQANAKSSSAAAITDALKECAAKNTALIVAGSFYLAAAARDIIINSNKSKEYKEDE